MLGINLCEPEKFICVLREGGREAPGKRSSFCDGIIKREGRYRVIKGCAGFSKNYYRSVL